MFNTQIWNFRQSILAKIGKPPMDCQCDYCEPEQTFACEGCLKKRAYCFGQDDDFFELCDDCWYKQEGDKEPEPPTPHELAISKKLKAWAEANPELHAQLSTIEQ